MNNIFIYTTYGNILTIDTANLIDYMPKDKRIYIASGWGSNHDIILKWKFDIYLKKCQMCIFINSSTQGLYLLSYPKNSQTLLHFGDNSSTIFLPLSGNTYTLTTIVNSLSIDPTNFNDYLPKDTYIYISSGWTSKYQIIIKWPAFDIYLNPSETCILVNSSDYGLYPVNFPRSLEYINGYDTMNTIWYSNVFLPPNYNRVKFKYYYISDLYPLSNKQVNLDNTLNSSVNRLYKADISFWNNNYSTNNVYSFMELVITSTGLQVNIKTLPVTSTSNAFFYVYYI
jgi:hypothetical protein